MRCPKCYTEMTATYVPGEGQVIAEEVSGRLVRAACEHGAIDHLHWDCRECGFRTATLPWDGERKHP